LPAFGQVSIGNFKLILSGPEASGSRPMPDGRQQEPGGWNRIVLKVQDLPARIAEFKNRISEMRWKSAPAACRFKLKTQMVTRLSYSSLSSIKEAVLESHYNALAHGLLGFKDVYDEKATSHDGLMNAFRLPLQFCH
jgi:hypothetical protein